MFEKRIHLARAAAEVDVPDLDEDEYVEGEDILVNECWQLAFEIMREKMNPPAAESLQKRFVEVGALEDLVHGLLPDVYHKYVADHAAKTSAEGQHKGKRGAKGGKGKGSKGREAKGVGKAEAKAESKAKAEAKAESKARPATKMERICTPSPSRRPRGGGREPAGNPVEVRWSGGPSGSRGSSPPRRRGGSPPRASGLQEHRPSGNRPSGSRPSGSSGPHGGRPWGTVRAAEDTDAMLEAPVVVDTRDEPPLPARLVHGARVDFLVQTCGIPEQAVRDGIWAEWQNVHGWNVMHFLAESLNKQHLTAEAYRNLEVDTFVWRFVYRGGDLDAHVDPGPSAAGKTPLLMLCQVQTSKAARTESHERDVAGLAECLLKYGASPIKCMGHGNGRAPLSHALAHGRMMVVKALIRYGASPYDVDANGDTAVEVARRNRTPAGQQNLKDALTFFDARPRGPRRPRAPSPSPSPDPKRMRTIDIDDIEL